MDMDILGNVLVKMDMDILGNVHMKIVDWVCMHGSEDPYQLKRNLNCLSFGILN